VSVQVTPTIPDEVADIIRQKLPPEHLPALASLFKPSGEGGRILDPVAGEGDALKYLAEAWNLTPFANELDIARAEECRAKFGPQRSVQGDMMTLRTPNQAYSVIYVNPPYAENTGGADEKRREFEMLAHAFKWAQDGAYAIWVVYAQHMTERAASFLVQAQQRRRYLPPARAASRYLSSDRGGGPRPASREGRDRR
jgi:hypothetical protein